MSWQHSKQAWYMQTFILHNKVYYIVHTNIHFAHQSILQTTYKHSFYTPKHITCKTFILHTQVYHHGRVKIKVYKTQANTNICHLCTIFQIVCSSKVLQDEHMGSCTGTTFIIHVLIEHEIWLPQAVSSLGYSLWIYRKWSLHFLERESFLQTPLEWLIGNLLFHKTKYSSNIIL